MSDEYALDILGWKGYAPWLYVYSAINQTFKEGWIPDNYYGKVVVPKLKGNYGTIAGYNSLTSRLLKTSLFPDLMYYVNGIWTTNEYEIISEKEVIVNAFKESEKLVYKIDNSLQGKGIFFIQRDNFNIEYLEQLGNGVLQKYIRQHPFFYDIMPNSVATLRITSVINDEGLASVRSCYLRVGRNSDTHVKSDSQIKVPINFQTGELNMYGYTSKWIKLEKHPDTGFIFKNKKIPNFYKCIDAAVNLHKMIPFARTVGWDMIINKKNNVQVMEWNGAHNGIKFSEAKQGPCFADLGWENLWKEN